MNNYIMTEQKTSITQTLQQSLNILSMNNHELETYILKEIEECPAIEVDENPIQYINSPKFYLSSLENKFDPLNVNIYKGEKLEDYLKSQIEIKFFTNAEYIALVSMIELLDKNGYLKETNEEISSIVGLDENKIIEFREYIQSLNPHGIGARDFKESLIIQLKMSKKYTFIFEIIINEYLEDLSKGNFNKVAKELNLTKEEVKNYFKEIRALNPKPANGFGLNQQNYIIPDILVEFNKNEYEVILNDSYIPKVVINNYWSKIKTNDTEIQNYIKEKYNKAQSIIKGIEERRKTLQKVAQIIVNTQYQFFRTGDPINLVPLNLQYIANATGVHQSTISRALNTKYLSCRHGIYSLKYFLVSGTTHKNHIVGDRSKENIKQEIKKLIQGENMEKPLSDSKIKEELQLLEIYISRRTVVKYREELGIPNSIKRGVM
ncbi:RNA polymerase sigma-54 factor [Candidatus Epulonipiscium fishelsonii]|uniref:RNA polymerase sigma-54 factor n=1 Tax=Candidatus Epulonipiscium fishelsonii TaxID=77094 RepID=A0ACC8XCN4_9FIRM|nr:RNA polymerase sigma-54 factor [Epulopiscium sp. SCG-B11WGA-EpuloA1]ONI43197.1 RNA polymerase sigma-54 factor [Epulopiscium sp. SCG-B05WGA-EpuloA1]